MTADWIEIFAGFVALLGLFLFSVNTFGDDDFDNRYTDFVTPIVSGLGGAAVGGVAWFVLNGFIILVACGVAVGFAVGLFFGRTEVHRRNGRRQDARITLGAEWVKITMGSVLFLGLIAAIFAALLVFVMGLPTSETIGEVALLYGMVVVTGVTINATGNLKDTELLKLGFVLTLVSILLAVSPAVIDVFSGPSR